LPALKLPNIGTLALVAADGEIIIFYQVDNRWDYLKPLMLSLV